MFQQQNSSGFLPSEFRHNNIGVSVLIEIRRIRMGFREKKIVSELEKNPESPSRKTTRVISKMTRDSMNLAA